MLFARTFARLKTGHLAVDQRQVNGDAIWFDRGDDATRAHGSVAPQGRSTLGSRGGAGPATRDAFGPRAPGAAGSVARGAFGSGSRDAFGPGAGAAFDHDGAIGPRLLGLAVLCVALFALATLVGFAAEAYAAPAGPARIVKGSDAPIAQPRVRVVDAPRAEEAFVLRLG